MDFNLLFTIIIYLLILIFTCFIVKVYTDFITISKKAKQEYDILQGDLIVEEKKHKIYSQNIILIDNLNESLFNRIIEIAKRLIFIQKFLL